MPSKPKSDDQQKAAKAAESPSADQAAQASVKEDAQAPKASAEKASPEKTEDKAEVKTEAKAPAKKEEKQATSPQTPDNSKARKAKTMEELLGLIDHQIVVPKRGETVTGTITRKGNKALYVDIGAKTEGIVAEKEYEAAREYIDELQVGEEIDVTVSSAENNQGQVLLSLRKAAADARWEYFEQAFENEETLEASGVDVNKGGLIVQVNGVRGFVPSSQFGKDLVGNYQQLKGKKIMVKAIEVDRDKNRLIFSERHVSEAEEIAKKEEALDAVKVNEIYEGVVSGVMHFGLFVTVEVPLAENGGTMGHVEGLVHISEISWEKVTHPKDYHAVGDRIQVRVLGVDEKTGKLNLSIKQMSDDPWKNIDERYPVGTTVEGVVSRVEPFGVFVNVEAGIDGLIHQSKLESGQAFQKGDHVTVHVESVSPEQKRMSLSLIETELPVAYK